MLKYLAILFFLTTSLSAQQRVTLDFLTYVQPAGWKEVKDPNGRSYTKEDGSKMAVVTLIRPLPSEKSSRENFDMVWRTVIAEGLGSTTPPTMGKAGPKDGWMGEVGYAPFENASLKGVALMTTLTGNGKVVAVFALTNSDEYIAEIEKFVDNISLPKIAPPAGETTSNPERQADAVPGKLLGRWQRSSGGSPSYADPASWGTAGYTKSRYEFKPDGTYIYTEWSFRYSHKYILIVVENGKYTVSGDSITISPLKSTITSYTKADGADALGSVVKTQARPLEKVSYRFTLHYFSGIQEWNLVLMAENSTQRDGQFSNNQTFKNAWYFDQRFTDTDLTSPRGN